MAVQGVVLVEPRRVELRGLPEPELAPGSVTIAPRAMGICGSDLHLFRHGRIGDSVVREPHLLGHETAGTVVAVGSGVDTLAVGDRVLVEPGVSCLACPFCLAGRYNICPNARFLGIPPTPGTMAERFVVPARWVHRLPDGMSFAAGALVEPFAVGLQAVQEAGVTAGQSVVVLGAGPIGLMVLQAARVRGGGPIISVDVSPAALDLARRLGADLTIDPREHDVAEVVRNATGGGADVVIEAVGASQTIQQTLDLVRRGGVVTLVGVASEPAVPLNTIKIVRTGLTVRSSFRYANQHKTAIALVASGRVQLEPIVTHTFPVADADDAIAYVDAHKQEVVKGVLVGEG